MLDRAPRSALSNCILCLYLLLTAPPCVGPTLLSFTHSGSLKGFPCSPAWACFLWQLHDSPPLLIRSQLTCQHPREVFPEGPHREPLLQLQGLWVSVSCFGALRGATVTWQYLGFSRVPAAIGYLGHCLCPPRCVIPSALMVIVTSQTINKDLLNDWLDCMFSFCLFCNKLSAPNFSPFFHWLFTFPPLLMRII